MIAPLLARLGIVLATFGAFGCTVDAKPSGEDFKPSDAGMDSGTGHRDAGMDSGIVKPMKDASVKPMKDSAVAPDEDTGVVMDSGSPDAGPPPIPPYVVPPLSGGGLSIGTNTCPGQPTACRYRLRHVIGAFGPTHRDTSISESASTHYRLGNVLFGPTK